MRRLHLPFDITLSTYRSEGKGGETFFLVLEGFDVIQVRGAHGWTRVETMDMDTAHPTGKNDYQVKWQVLQ